MPLSKIMGMKHTDQDSEKDFSQFFDTYKGQVYGYVLTIIKDKTLAEEITQDIFMKLWTVRDILHTIRNIDNYIFILARNRSLNHLRKVKSDHKALEELRYHIVQSHNPVEEHLLQRDYQDVVQKAVGALSAQRRLVYQLSREEGLSMNEIADRLLLSPNTVKNHLIAALKHIRHYLEQHGGIVALLTFFMFL